MIYGELCCYPLSKKIQQRMLSYWNRLISNENKLSSKLYKLMYKLHMNGTTTFKWISFVQSVFNDTGLSYVFESQFPICMSSIKSVIKQRLCDQFFKNDFLILDNSTREFYKVVKKDLKFEEYLIRLSRQDRVCITKFRTSYLKLPIGTGRWNNIAKELRLCSFCNKKNWR